MKLVIVFALLGAVSTLSACGRFGFEPRPGAVGVDTGPASDTGAVGVSVAGHWVRAAGAMDFGDMYFAEIGGQIRGVYTYREGRIVGDLGGDALDCWWSEMGRMGNDVGACTFVFSENATEKRAAGSWVEGGGPMSGWDLDYSDPTIPPAIMADLLVDADFVDGR